MTDDRYARAVARIVFGVVMLVGAAVMLQRLLAGGVVESNKVIAATWILAVICGVVARFVADGKNVERIFVLSYAVPTLGVALLLPLSLHLVAAVALGLVEQFDTWVRLSLKLTGAAHIGFAFLATRRAVRLAQGRTAQSAHDVFLGTLVVASIPFGLIIFPPMLVAVTGIPILPLLERMRPMIEREANA